MTKRIGRAAVTMVIAAALLVPVAAQGKVPADVARAKALKAQAEAMFGQPAQWRKVAKLMEESAALRPAEDAEKFECLQYAGRIRATLGEAKYAQKLLEKAAEAALERGAVIEAAEAYVDAAFAAHAATDFTAAAELAGRAKLLAGSPLLTEKDRNRVLSRVN